MPLSSSSSPRHPQVLQTVFGVFHHFDLARELDKRNQLQAIFSTWPWKRIQREAIAREKVRTFPWLHLFEIGIGRIPIDLHLLTDIIGYSNALAFDRWTLRQLQKMKPLPDVLIGIAGSSLTSGAWLQQHGGLFICDRGSTHQRYQEQIVGDEYSRWGVTLPSTDERDTRREEKIYSQADAIVVPSQFAARSFTDFGIPAKKVHVIPYGVRLEKFQPTGEPPIDEFCLLFAGQVSLRKGFPYLLEAFEKLNHPRKRLRVVGAIHKDMRSVLDRLPTDNVEFLGILPQQELAGWMSRSHLLVLPSIEEGLALVQAQALACGCPVLCTPNTGAEDLLTDGVEGFIVPLRDPEALRQRMEQIADDPALWKQMRHAALLRVQSFGGWSTYGDRWQSLLDQLWYRP